MATSIGTTNRPVTLRGNAGIVRRSQLSNARSANASAAKNNTPQVANPPVQPAPSTTPKPQTFADSNPTGSPLTRVSLPDGYRAPYDFDQGLRAQVSGDILQTWFDR